MTDWLVDASLEPVVAGVLEPMYRAAARGELQMPFCATCDAVVELGQVRCDLCGATATQWREVAPTGTIHSATTVHRLEQGLVLATEPYPVVDVELSSGHRIIMTTVSPCSDSPRIGDPATIVFRTVGTVAIPSLAVPDRTTPDRTTPDRTEQSSNAITSKGTS
jgi:uncharacterized protein